MPFYHLINENFIEIEGACVALIGGGGKTALLHKLANELAEKFPRVLQTSVTKTAFNECDNPIIFQDVDQISQNNQNPLFVIGEKISESKLLGITTSDLDSIINYFNVSIFECDGARNKPLKAHTDYDPIVPDFTTHVIILIGADVINTQIGDGLVHRPELFCKKWNVDAKSKMGNDFIIRVVNSKKGYLEKINHEPQISYFINKADVHLKEAASLANDIKNTVNRPVFYGSIKNNLLVAV